MSETAIIANVSAWLARMVRSGSVVSVTTTPPQAAAAGVGSTVSLTITVSSPST